MRLFAVLPLLIFAVLISGCASKKPALPAQNSVPVVVTPDNSLSAKVISCNAAARFVVLNFPVGEMPKTGETFFLYRNGLKTGEVKITGPQRDNNIVADLTAGDAQVGDDVREQ